MFILLIYIPVFGLLIYFSARINKVGIFRMDLIDKIAAYGKREKDINKWGERFEYGAKHFLQDVSFNSMVYSFKPLKLESYYTEEAIRELLYG